MRPVVRGGETGVIPLLKKYGQRSQASVRLVMFRQPDGMNPSKPLHLNVETITGRMQSADGLVSVLRPHEARLSARWKHLCQREESGEVWFGGYLHASRLRKSGASNTEVAS
jgi:hypothetical protein